MKANIYKNKTKLTSGFTLIELLVVVSIIGMLASVVLVSLQGARTKAKDAKLILEVRELQKAIEVYKLDNNNIAPRDGWFHSTAVTCAVAAGNNNETLTTPGAFDGNFVPKYIAKLPVELKTCGLYYIGFNPSQANNQTSLTCDNGTSVFDPDGFPAGDLYSYLFVVELLNTYPPSPNLPKASWGGNIVNGYCILGPKL